LQDEFDSATANEVTWEEIYRAIIAYRKTAKHLPEEERDALDRQIAEYSNNQVKQTPPEKKTSRVKAVQSLAALWMSLTLPHAPLPRRCVFDPRVLGASVGSKLCGELRFERPLHFI
jgi:hypothetical protein